MAQAAVMSECEHDVIRCDPHCCDEIRCLRCNVVLALVTYQEMRKELAAQGEEGIEHWIDKLKAWKQKRSLMMDEFKQYRRRQIAELRPWKEGDDMTRISVSAADKDAGSPKSGDMVARNPKNHDDKWLVAAVYFADNFEPA
jgi:hypothetical protein